MRSAESELAGRKELLLARSALDRVRLRYQLVALRSRVPSRAATVFGVLLFAFARLGAARWIAKGARILVLLRSIRAALRLLRRK